MSFEAGLTLEHCFGSVGGFDKEIRVGEPVDMGGSSVVLGGRSGGDSRKLIDFQGEFRSERKVLVVESRRFEREGV